MAFPTGQDGQCYIISGGAKLCGACRRLVQPFHFAHRHRHVRGCALARKYLGNPRLCDDVCRGRQERGQKAACLRSTGTPLL